jgi:nitrite reductase/ring-hydroxylating ferredoxin subunit
LGRSRQQPREAIRIEAFDGPGDVASKARPSSPTGVLAMHDRRRFLKVVGVAACAWGGSSLATACYGGADGETGQQPATGSFPAGNVKDLSVGSIVPVADKPVVIARDAAGLYAMSTICTHQQCDIRKSGAVRNDGLDCGCHGSRFDRNGSPIAGPAPRALDHYQVTLAADGSVTINASQVVSADTRTPVP